MKQNEEYQDVVGPSLKELDLQTIQSVYGGYGADVEPRSSLVCTALFSFVGSYLGSATFKCGKDNKK
ncbi:hypothetical protein [Bacillus sp. H1a]|uniref:hypothetical protein n=1 Tax=Bacillus sp. H1a TaxID=1397276 RepID=UPI000469E526|nr:hypothetical protein [Bacillus sp. H1a]